MSEHFTQKPFGQLLKKVIDNRGKTCPTASIGIPLIATNCIKNENLYPVFENVRHVSRDTYDNWFRGHPEPGDMIFVTKGTPGRVCWTPNPVPFCIAQDMVAIRADEDKVYPRYLFAVLRSKQLQGEIENLHVGTLIPHFKKGDFDDLLIPIPNETGQRYIGDLYFELSLKIDLLDRQNKTLEGLTETLFRQWFVKEADDAWEIVRISELTKNIQYGFTASASWKKIGSQFLRITDIQGGRINWETVPYCEVSVQDYDKYKLETGDVLVARTGASTGENCYITNPENSIFASYLVRFQFESPSVGRYVATFMRTENYFEYIAGCLGGSAQPNASAKVLGGAELRLPPVSRLENYYHHVSEMDRKAHQNNLQIRTLTQLRDTLLPKLMSGEVRVKI